MKSTISLFLMAIVAAATLSACPGTGSPGSTPKPTPTPTPGGSVSVDVGANN